MKYVDTLLLIESTVRTLAAMEVYNYIKKFYEI